MYKLFSCFNIWISNFALNQTLQASTAQNHRKWHALCICSGQRYFRIDENDLRLCISLIILVFFIWRFWLSDLSYAKSDPKRINQHFNNYECCLILASKQRDQVRISMLCIKFHCSSSMLWLFFEKAVRIFPYSSGLQDPLLEFGGSNSLWLVNLWTIMNYGFLFRTLFPSKKAPLSWNGTCSSAVAALKMSLLRSSDDIDYLIDFRFSSMDQIY